MYTQDVQESIISSFQTATGTPTQGLRCSLVNGEKQSMTIEGSKTDAKGESTNTKLTIEEVERGKYKFTGSIEHPQRSLQIDRTIVTTPTQLASVVKNVLVMARVARPKEGVLGKIRHYI